MWSLLKRHRILVFVTLVCVAMVLLGWGLRAEAAEPGLAACLLGAPAAPSCDAVRM